MYVHVHTHITPHHTLSHIHIHGYTQTHTCTTNKHRHIYTHTHHTHTQIFTRYICFIHKHADKYHKFPPHTCNYVHISCLYHLIMENNLLKIFNHLFLSSISQKKKLEQSEISPDPTFEVLKYFPQLHFSLWFMSIPSFLLSSQGVLI